VSTFSKPQFGQIIHHRLAVPGREGRVDLSRTHAGTAQG